jgi:hypothetical protein
MLENYRVASRVVLISTELVIHQNVHNLKSNSKYLFLTSVFLHTPPFIIIRGMIRLSVLNDGEKKARANRLQWRFNAHNA